MAANDDINALDLSPAAVPLLYLVRTVQVFAIVALLWLIGRNWMDFGFMAAWQSHGAILDGLSQVWFIFVWGAGITAGIRLVLIIRKEPRDRPPGESFVKGLWLSVNAGFFEEVIYRWLMFLGAMVVVRFLNPFGFPEWLQTQIFLPFANFLTLGALSPQLLTMGWVFGAAIVLVNGQFKDAHEHLGIFGKVNAYFLGMVMFWLMFNYGLATAIVAHALYDICVFSTGALLSTFQPAYNQIHFSHALLNEALRRRR